MNELDVVVPGNRVALAMVLDGRESVSVPAWWIGIAPVNRFQALPPGPLILVNSGWNQLSLVLAHSDASDDIARWQEGQTPDGVEIQNLTLEPQTSVVIMPLRTFLGIQSGEGNTGAGVLRPVGILTRGPSSLLALAPFTVELG